MQVTGLMNNQVLQRNAKNLCEVTISERCNDDGSLQIKVTKNGRAVPGFGLKTIGKVTKRRFKCKVRGVPVGGPYNITLKLAGSAEQLEFKNILVGDVWILAGQSNMVGVGWLKDAAKPNRMVRAFYMDDRWDIARDPIHNFYESTDRIHIDLYGDEPIGLSKHIGTGPGVAFGKEMYKQTGVPQGLISCAQGATEMTQWDPKLKRLGGKSLYGAMLRRFNKNGGNVAGMIWHQGCSDAHTDRFELYTKRMKKFIFSVRRDFNNKKLPVTMAQIARVSYCNDPEVEDFKHWNSIQEQQRLLPKVIDRLTVVPTIDLGLEDMIHLSGKAQNRLGKRLAYAALVQRLGRKAGKAPIELKSVTSRIDKIHQTWVIEVAFANVHGSLKASGTPAGFSLTHSNNTECKTIFGIELKANKAILKTGLLVTEKHQVRLHYGFGCNPYCNITDGTDRSLPAFGPVEIVF